MPDIVKGDGTVEPFQVAKLVRSLEHSGADSALAKHIGEIIGSSLKAGSTTTEIYKNAFALLKKEEHVVAARYSMRRAIFDLGPTGFPFEKYVAALMHAKGYETSYDVTVQGRCIDHEVDVVMRKDGKAIGAELKFHNTPGSKTDLKTALYVRARYWDIEWGAKDRNEKAGIDEGWLITNTKFTSKAIQYSECAGIKLLGWSYPQGAGLSDLIRETGLYPVTILMSLSQAEKARLVDAGVTMCHMLASNPDSLAKAGIVGKKQNLAVEESRAICQV
ncbi:MAG: restriction endonuclease [Patescibacteria group bacterium]